MVVLFRLSITPTEEVEHVYLGPDSQLVEMDVRPFLPPESGPVFKFGISMVTVDALSEC